MIVTGQAFGALHAGLLPASRQSKHPLALPGIQSRDAFIRLTNGKSSLKSLTPVMFVPSGALGSVPACAMETKASSKRAKRRIGFIVGS